MTRAVGSIATTKYVYDVMGRTVGVLEPGDAVWTCTAYDAHGRVASIAYPQFTSGSTTFPARTLAYSYADTGGNPETTSVSDASGTIVQSTNLLGSVLTYTDTSGAVTTNTWDVMGRLVSSSAAPPPSSGGLRTVSETYGYNADSKVTSISLNGATIATSTYSSAKGRLSGITYGTARVSVQLFNRLSGLHLSGPTGE